MAGLDLRGPLALDSNCLIYLLEQEGALAAKVEMAMREATEVGTVISTLSVTELLAGAMRHGGAETAAVLAAVVKETPGLDIVPLDLDVAEQAARVRATSSLKLPDAVVVATALIARADVLLTNDRQVAAVKVDGLRIVYLDDLEA